MNLKLYSIFLFVGVLLFVVFFSICFFCSEDLQTVNIGMNMWPGYSHHTLIGIENGFFENLGVDLRVNIFDDYTDSLDAFRDGSIDGFFGVYSDALSLVEEGYLIKVVYVSDFSNGGDVIVSRPDVKKISDLKGERVGVVQLDGFSHLFVLDLLRDSEVNSSDVEIVQVAESDVIKMLEAGYIAAGHTFEPFQTEALEKGYNLLASSRDLPGSIVDVLVLRADFVEENPVAVYGLVRGLLEAQEYMDKNSEEVYSYVSVKSGIDSSELKEISSGIKILSRFDNKEMFDKNNENSLYFKGEFILDFFSEKQGSVDSFNLDEIIDGSFVG